MKDFGILIAVFLGWYLLNVWVLPKFGVQT